MSRTKEVIGDISFYSSSILLTQAITVASAVIMRRFLGPAQVGVWAFVQVVLTYAEYANLGSVTAAGLEIPFYNGKGQPEKADEIKNTVFSFSILSSILISIAIILYVLIRRASLEKELFYGLLFASGLVLLQKLNGLLVTLLRAYKRFTLAGKQMLYSALVNAVLIAGLSFRFRLYGFLVAMCLSFVFNIAYILRREPFSFQLRMNLSKLWSLIAYGLPLMLIALLGTFFETIDRIMITKFMGLEALGLYSIALMTYAYINGIPNSIGIVMIPNIQEKFGRTENKHDLKGYLHKAEMGLSAIIPVLIGFSWFVVPYLVQVILPKFVEGTGSLRALILGAYFLALGQVYSQFVYVIRKHLALFPVVGLSCVFAVLFNGVAIHRNLGIQGVGIATTLAMFCNFTMIYFYASTHVRRPRESLKGYLALVFKFAWLVMLLFLIYRYVRLGGSFVTMLSQVTVFFAASMPGLIEINKEFGLIAMIRNKFARRGAY